MFSVEEKECIEKRKLKRLTFFIPEQESLFQTIYGACTVSRLLELEKLYSEYRQKQNELKQARPKPVKHEVSWEMGLQNEQCIEEHGCSLYQFW